ncbi:MAG: hypothetical protein HYT06_01400 [Candidatus Levybacteria bacterium]|nr:hypothetical protein [Candidatus Levybacteria bacterium]
MVAPTERGRVPEASFTPMQEYKVRLLTGQFDTSKYDVRLATRLLPENNPSRAYEVMHETWMSARKRAWASDRRVTDERVRLWAEGRAKATMVVLQSGAISSSLLDGLRIIGLDIQDPVDAEVEDLQEYFSGDFYGRYAGDKDKSVGNLGETFFDKCLTKGDRRGNGRKVDARKAKKIMEQLVATKDVLAPILEPETFAKLYDVVQAKIDNGLGRLTSVLTPLSDPQKKQLGIQLDYFTRQPLPEPTVAVAARPTVMARPTVTRPGVEVTAAVAPAVTAEPTRPHIIEIEGGEDEAISELNAKLKVDPDKSNLRVTFPVDSIRRYLVQSAVPDMEVIAAGVAQRDRDKENVINVTGVKIKGKDEPVERALAIDYTIDNDEEGSMRIVLNKITTEDGREFRPEEKTMAERGTFKDVRQEALTRLEQDLDEENKEWHPKGIAVTEKGIEIEFVNYAPLGPVVEISPIPPPTKEEGEVSLETDDEDMVGATS